MQYRVEMQRDPVYTELRRIVKFMTAFSFLDAPKNRRESIHQKGPSPTPEKYVSNKPSITNQHYREIRVKRIHQKVGEESWRWTASFSENRKSDASYDFLAKQEVFAQRTARRVAVTLMKSRYDTLLYVITITITSHKTAKQSSVLVIGIVLRVWIHHGDDGVYRLQG
jgi:hypothetical protein